MVLIGKIINYQPNYIFANNTLKKKQFLLLTIQGIYLRAFAPVAKWSAGVLVLSSHTENILLGFDFDLIHSVLSGDVLHKRRRGVTGRQQMHFYSVT